MESHTITYSNHFFFQGATLAFRNKLLFDITKTPRYLPVKEYANGSKGWYINRTWLSITKAKEMAKTMMPINVDVSDLQWYQQIQLDQCFNL